MVPLARLAEVVTQTFRSFRADALAERFLRDPLDNWWKNYSNKLHQAGSDGPVQIAFFISVFASMGHVARSDGVIKPAEIALASRLMEHLQLNAEQKKLAIRLFNEGKHQQFALDTLLQRFYRQCHHRVSVLQVFLEMQLQMAYADNGMSEAEYRLMQRICKRIDISAAVMTRIDRRVRAEKQARHQPVTAYAGQPMSQASACELLGLSRRASQAEVKRAYRRKVSQCHPDKLQARQASPAEIIEAQDMALELRRAYELLSRHKKNVK
jgi:DnaJ like chaperone protein